MTYDERITRDLRAAAWHEAAHAAACEAAGVAWTGVEIWRTAWRPDDLHDHLGVRGCVHMAPRTLAQLVERATDHVAIYMAGPVGTAMASGSWDAEDMAGWTDSERCEELLEGECEGPDLAGGDLEIVAWLRTYAAQYDEDAAFKAAVAAARSPRAREIMDALLAAWDGTCACLGDPPHRAYQPTTQVVRRAAWRAPR